MNRRLFILTACLFCSLASCIKPEDRIPADTPMTFKLEILQTKAADDDWVNGDKVYVFVNGIGGKYVSMAYDGRDWTTTTSAEFVKGDFSDPEKATLTAVYFPVPVDVIYADDKFSFTSGGEKVYSYYLLATGTAYSVDGTEVTATLEMGKTADFVGIFMEGLQADVDKYTLSCPLIRPVACESVGKDGVVTEDARQAGARISGIVSGDGVLFAGGLVRPGVSADYVFTLSADYKVYTLVQERQTLEAKRIYEYPSLSGASGGDWSSTNVSGLFVDLGLSVNWAGCNLGAGTETEVGNSFSWGAINGGNSNASWSDYLYYSEGKVTKYTGGDFTVLQAEDDAAYASLGGQFRMPTEKEWEELINQCNWEWKGNGFEVSGKLEGFTDRSIFLPAANYWSSSLSAASNENAGCAHLQSGEASLKSLQRYSGCAIRPVASYEGDILNDYNYGDL